MKKVCMYIYYSVLQCIHIDKQANKITFDKDKDKEKEKTKTKCFNDPTCAVFLTSRGCKE